MRKRETFLLTILTPENEETTLCGKIKQISSGKTCTFASAEELYQLLSAEMVEPPVGGMAAHCSPAANPVEERRLSS